MSTEVAESTSPEVGPQKQLAVRISEGYTGTIPAEALAKRGEYLEEAALIVNISNVDDQKLATKIGAKLKQWAKGVEDDRLFFTRKLDAAKSALKSVADEARAIALNEVSRIQGLLVDFDNAQEAIRLAEQAERDRIAAEAAETERKRLAAIQAETDEIERQRVEAERLITEGKNLKARQAAAAEAKRLEDLQTAAELEQEFAKPAPAPAPYVPLPTVVKPKGAAVRIPVQFEITDIKALYAAHPNCVELVVKKDPLNYLLNTPGIDLASIPGVKAWREKAVSIRSAA